MNISSLGHTKTQFSTSCLRPNSPAFSRINETLCHSTIMDSPFITALWLADWLTDLSHHQMTVSESPATFESCSSSSSPLPVLFLDVEIDASSHWGWKGTISQTWLICPRETGSTHHILFIPVPKVHLSSTTFLFSLLHEKLFSARKHRSCFYSYCICPIWRKSHVQTATDVFVFPLPRGWLWQEGQAWRNDW